MFTVEEGLERAHLWTLEHDEEWRHLEEFRGYFVSNYGQVYSWRTDAVVEPVGGKVTLAGYQELGRRVTRRTDVLVAIAFLGGYRPGLDVKHLDGDMENDYFENLEWVSRPRSRGDFKLNYGTGPVPVRILELDRAFSSVTECARYLRISTRTVRRAMQDGGKLGDLTIEELYSA